MLTSKEQVLAQWRRVDLTAQERAARPSSKAVSGILPGVLKGLGLDRRRAEVEILKVWSSLIDPNIVAHAQPANIRNGTLFVNVDNSAWLNEIVRYRYKEILDRLQHSFGRDTIARISFRVG